MTFRNRAPEKWILILLSAPAIAIIYTVAGPSVARGINHLTSSGKQRAAVTFQSSDGGWSGEEDLIAGKDFRSVVTAFELYKIHCGKSDAILQRTKDKKKPWNPGWWSDNYNAPKWKVPYHETITVVHARYVDCSSQTSSPQQTALAEARADRYIANLK